MDQLIGKYVIVRCSRAGVHAGVLEAHEGEVVELTESRRLWRWHAKVGVSLSGVAVAGLEDDSITEPVLSRIRLLDACEIIECTAEAEASIRGQA